LATTCALCGAALAPGETCRDRFDATLALEIENPSAYGAVHHLSVLCYMLQHNAYSRAAWPAARQLLHEFVHDGLTATQTRRRNRARFDNEHRSWSVTQGARLPGVGTVAWTRTMADVRVDTVEQYCADVRDWARAVLADTATIARQYDSET
jgi:hypothetical protein